MASPATPPGGTPPAARMTPVVRPAEPPLKKRTRAGSCYRFLKIMLRVTNVLLILIGLAMVGYAVYMFIDFKKMRFGPVAHVNSPWFIYTFGAAGIFVILASASGLSGVAFSNRICLNINAIMIIILLLFEAAMLIAYFADESWRRKIPQDDSGEAAVIGRFIQRRLDVCKWLGLTLLILQALSVALAWALAYLQAQIVVEAASDEDDEVWGRRRLLAPEDRETTPTAAGASGLGGGGAGTGLDGRVRNDPWSRRMREKYGLDTSQFGYDPETATPAQPAPLPPAPKAKQSGCTIM